MSKFAKACRKIAVKTGFLAVVLVSVAAMNAKAEAAWGDLFCDISNGDAGDLQHAVDLYNANNEDGRQCTMAIRFYAHQTIVKPDGLVITQSPPAGKQYGFSIRKCIPSGPYADPGCPALTADDIVLDFTGYTQNNGDCPILVKDGAKIDFRNITLKVRNPATAVCTYTNRTPIPQDNDSDPTNNNNNPLDNFAWIPADVKIISDNPNPRPTCTINNTASSSGGFDVTWSTTNATSGTVTASDGSSGGTGTSGTIHVTPTSSTIYTLNATGAGGSCTATTTVNPATVVPTCTINNTVHPGGGFDVTWSTTNATSGTVNDGTTDVGTGTSGTVTENPSSPTTYTLHATGPGGMCTATTTVTPSVLVPTCNISATSSAGGGFDLTWISTNGTSATLNDGSGPTGIPVNGGSHVDPTSTTTYTFTVTGAGGTCSDTVTVTPPPTCDITSTPSGGGGFDLAWTSTNATSATLDEGAGPNPALTSGTKHVNPSVTTIYTLAVNGLGGSCSDAVAVVPPSPTAPTCTLTATPAGGGTYTLTWGTTGATTITLDEGSGPNPVAVSGSKPETPLVPTTYVLAATSSGGSCSSAVTLTPPGYVPPVPTCSLTAAAMGGGFTLNWVTTNGTTITLNEGSGPNPVAASGSKPETPSVPTTYTLSATNAAGSCTTSLTLTPGGPVPPPSPTCSMTAAPAGPGSFTLTWTTTNGTTITLDEGSGPNPVAASGSKLETPVGTINYVLTATNASGSCSTTVTLPPGGGVILPAPTCNLTAAPAGPGSFTLTWITTNGTATTLNEGSGPIVVAASGTKTETPLVVTTYTLTAVNSSGSCTTAVTLSPGGPVPPPAPTCSLTAAPAGPGSFTLTWLTTNGTTITLDEGSGPNPVAAAGSKPETPVGTINYILTATNASGSCSTSVTLPPLPLPPPPTCTFTATPGAGGSTDLTWSTTNAVTVTLDEGSGPNPVGTSGTQNVNPLVTTTYTLAATGGGGSCAKAIVLSPGTPIPTAPVCNLTAAPSGPTDFILTWTTTGATVVTLSDGTTTNPVALNGSQTVTPSLPSTTYTLTGTSSGGVCSKSIVLTPGGPVPTVPSCNMTATAGAGNSFNLTWTTANATTVTLNEGAGPNPVNPNDTKNVIPTVPTVYTLAATSSGGSCSQGITLSPVGSTQTPPACSLTAATAGPTDFTLTWTTTGATTVTLDEGSGANPVAANGSKTETPVSTTTYTLSATSAGGSCTKSIVLTPGSPVPATPTCILTATAGTGTSFILNWATTGSSSVTLSDGSSTPLSTDSNGTKTVNPLVTTTYTLAATAAGGSCSKALNINPLIPPAPTCTLTATNTSGNDFNLTWSTTGATSVSLTQGSTLISNAPSGTQAETVTTATTYTLTATGTGGTCSKDVTAVPPGPVVGPPPDCALTATSVSGGGFDLTWTSSNATSVKLEEGLTTVASDLNSTKPFRANPTAPTQYLLTATGTGGVCSRGLVLSPPPTPSVSANDSDGDGLTDDDEINIYHTDPHNPDTDGDGLNDGDEVHNPFYPVCGPLNPDCDNDGICDGPKTVTDKLGNVICTAFNGHGDNCELVSNGPKTPAIQPNQIQLDSDGNGIGDACEGDWDGDGVPNNIDNCPFQPNADQLDRNGNGIGDVCDMSLSILQGGGGIGGCSLTDVAGGSASDLWMLLFAGAPMVLRLGRRKKG